MTKDEAMIINVLSSEVDQSSSDDETGEEKSVLSPSPIRTSTWKTTINIASYTLGVGVLAMPYAVMKGGVTAILFLFIVPFIYWWANKIIIECLYESENQARSARVRSTWKEIGEVLSPKYGGIIVVFLQNFILFLVSSSYLVLCGSLMVNILSSLPVTQAMWTCIATVLVFPTAFLKSYSQIAWLSVFCVVTLIVTVGTIVWQSVAHIEKWDIGAILFWDNQGVLVSLGTLLYSYAYFELIPSVEDSMLHREELGRSMAWAMLIIGMVNIPFSVCAFLWFGFDTDEIVINNLPAGPVHTSIVAGFVISFLFSYALPLQPAFLLFEESEIFQNLSRKFSFSFCFFVTRFTVVCFTLVLAILIPHFALLSSFDGGTVSPVLAFIIPCSVYFKLRRHELSAFQITALSFLFIFGVTVTTLSGGLFFAKAIAIVL